MDTIHGSGSTIAAEGASVVVVRRIQAAVGPVISWMIAYAVAGRARTSGRQLWERWRLMHLVTGAVGGLATTLWFGPILERAELGAPGLLLALAAAPIAVYQGWALRRMAPMLWPMLALFLALPAAPYLSVWLWAILLGEKPNYLMTVLGWASPALISPVWVAPLLFIPLRRSVQFRRWFAIGGAALAIGAIAVFYGFICALLMAVPFWALGIVVASTVFGVMTYPLLAPLLGAGGETASGRRP
jgi:hypothetical protein